MTSAIPKGFTTLTPNIVVKDAAKAIELYKKAFGAKEISRMEHPETKKILHAELEIGNSKVFLSDEMPGMSTATTGASFYMYVPDVDAAMAMAVKSGLKEIMKTEDMFYGDRLGALSDEFGIHWTVATHTRDVSEEDVKQAAKKMFAGNKGGEQHKAAHGG